MDRATQRYMATLTKLLTDYAFAGIQALGLVPDFLVETATQPEPKFSVAFRQNGELHSYFGTYGQHALTLALMASKK